MDPNLVKYEKPTQRSRPKPYRAARSALFFAYHYTDYNHKFYLLLYGHKDDSDSDEHDGALGFHAAPPTCTCCAATSAEVGENLPTLASSVWASSRSSRADESSPRPAALTTPAAPPANPEELQQLLLLLQHGWSEFNSLDAPGDSNVDKDCRDKDELPAHVVRQLSDRRLLAGGLAAKLFRLLARQWISPQEMATRVLYPRGAVT
ncbi:hypothetical protein B0H66DRAFT_608396 [Apodospora peruviana]|uniref:Uncharacterized protein n=1 Tax=Apodospora peruviana TaxID=516989 RepID=A0AAE0LYB8_9PEZI|nr:hypothetical protein B0H66DRAFT_608396 [Apodospora peruviana]